MSLPNKSSMVEKKGLSEKIKEAFSEELFRYKFITTLIFLCIITMLAWQSDDAYHAYVMAKNLVLGNGFVYNIGERASATSCPLFTLIIACGYLVFRKMFIVSLLICIFFSTSAYIIVLNNFCKTKKQIILTFVTLIGSTCFISYTTSGLENCLLFFLTALFLKYYYKSEKYTGWELFRLAILVSLIAMTRMDAVLLVVPMIVFIYLAKRKDVSFIKVVFIGILGLMPFILWEIFSVIYFGFPVPNTAYVKLGTDIPKYQYIYRGLQYLFTSALCDAILIIVPCLVVVFSLTLKKSKYIYCSLGVLLYFAYVIYIGGDFMLGRHFTVLFFMSVISYLEMNNNKFHENKRGIIFEKLLIIAVFLCLVFNATTKDVTKQFLFGDRFNSPISDERAGYFQFTSLFNNMYSYFRTGELVLRDAWNEQGIDEYRGKGYKGGILRMVPGISIYYNSDMYLNDQYALGDPFLSKLPAVREENWRIGHMWREVPPGYGNSVLYEENQIENEDLKEYYEIIKLITRGPIWDKDRLNAVINMNLGKYDYLLDSYKESLDENCRLTSEE